MRAIFVLITLIAISLSWYSRHMEYAHVVERVKIRVKQLGGALACEREMNSESSESGGRDVSPIRAVCFDRLLIDDVEYIDLSDTTVTDADIKYIAKLKNIKTLIVNLTGVTDAGMDHVVRMTSLTELYLLGTRISDKGMATLCRLPNLRTLDIRETDVTDAACGSLGTMHRLRLLKVTKSHLTNNGVACLRSQLKHCSVSN